MAVYRNSYAQIRLNLNSYAVNLVDQPSAAGRVAPLNSGMMEAEQRCLGLSMRSLYQLRRLFDIDERVLHYAQDSMSIMIACESLRPSTVSLTEMQDAACYLRRVRHICLCSWILSRPARQQPYVL